MAGDPDYISYVNLYPKIAEYAKKNGYTSAEQKYELGRLHWEKYGKSENRILPTFPANSSSRVSEQTAESVTGKRDVSRDRTDAEKLAQINAERQTSGLPALDSLSEVNPMLLYVFAGLAALIVLRG